MENNFETWMIVFCQNKERVKSFNKANKLMKLNLFPAINTIHYYNEYANLALGKSYCTHYYEQIIRDVPGKLGCNLSHQMLIEMMYEQSQHDWCLVLEDDVEIDTEYFLKNVNKILEESDKKGALFIQLYSHPKFFDLQKKQKQVYDDLYKMTFQWGTCAYFIHKKAMKDFIDIYPLNENIDIEFGKKISKWKSLCWLNNGIKTIGSQDYSDKTSKLGSIIYSIGV